MTEDIQGLRYLDNRDMIDFVDSTENPVDEERYESVSVGSEQPAHRGGSYLTVQVYIDREQPWDAQTTEYQEQVVEDGEEIKMYRQNRPFGNAIEHETVFIGFARNPEVVATSLEQMITADHDGNHDRLSDLIEAKTGRNYFVASQVFLEEFAR